MLGIIIPGAAVVIVAAMLIIVKTSDKEHKETQEHLSAMQAVVTAGLLGAVPKPKPRTETVNGTAYIFREHWWFRQYPINDKISLELCVGYGVEWIEGLKPKLDKDQMHSAALERLAVRIEDYSFRGLIESKYALPAKPKHGDIYFTDIGEKYWVCIGDVWKVAIGSRTHIHTKILSKLPLLVRRDNQGSIPVSLGTAEHQPGESFQICNINNHHQDLQRMIDACCCTTNADRTRREMEMCCQSTESRINELRQQLCEQQMQARSAEMYNRMLQVAPPLPVYPSSAYQTYYQAGYQYGQWMQ